MLLTVIHSDFFCFFKQMHHVVFSVRRLCVHAFVLLPAVAVISRVFAEVPQSVVLLEQPPSIGASVLEQMAMADPAALPSPYNY